MPTLGEMIDETIDSLQGMSVSGDSMSWLTVTISPTDLTFDVGDASSLSGGLIEIEQELMWVSSVDKTAGTVTVAPFGRGFKGTSAQPHQVLAPIRMSPSWTRFGVAREINNQINALYPDLFAPVVQTFSADATTTMYELAPQGDFVIDVRWQFPPFDMQRARKWEVQRGPDEFNRLWLYDDIPTTSAIEVTYASAPGLLATEDAVFSATGYQDSVKDLVMLGVLAKLTQFKDNQRLDVITAESAQMAGQNQQGGAGTSLSRDYRQQYAQRLAGEIQRQYARYPSHTHIVS